MGVALMPKLEVRVWRHILDEPFDLDWRQAANLVGRPADKLEVVP